MNESTLGNNIARLRKAAGFTQEQVAARLGLTYQAVSKWETNQSCPDVMLLPQIADCFGVSIDTLFGREPAPTLLLPPRPAEEEEEVRRSSQLPWPDDDTLYAVLFKGHTPLTDEPLAYSGEREEIHFVYSGPALNVISHFNLSCEDCRIQGDICAGGDVHCGNVDGNVSAGGDVHCGDVGGSVHGNCDVNCGDVGGNVNASCDVSCGDVGGSVSTGCNVSCGDVGGSVTAGMGVECGDISGCTAGACSGVKKQIKKTPHIHVDLVHDDGKGPERVLKKEYDLDFSSFSEDMRAIAKDIRNLFRKR